MRVDQIWRFPVKSLGGETIDAAGLDAFGIEGDRAWGLYDPSTGLVLTARREPRLLFLNARLDAGIPLITSHDGTVLPDDDALSAWLGHRVELRTADQGEASFEAPLDEDDETDWVTWSSTDGTLHDTRAKVSLVSRSTLGDWDVRRFRINLVLDEPGDDGLDGDIAIGSARLTIRKPISRCLMVTRAQPGIERDLEVLRRLHRERANQLGIGASVIAAGTIAVGDEVVPA